MGEVGVHADLEPALSLRIGAHAARVAGEVPRGLEKIPILLSVAQGCQIVNQSIEHAGSCSVDNDRKWNQSHTSHRNTPCVYKTAAKKVCTVHKIQTSPEDGNMLHFLFPDFENDHSSFDTPT